MLSSALETSSCDLSVMDCMFAFPLNPYVEDLIRNVMVFGDGAFGKLLGHEGRAFMIVPL